MDLPNNQYNQHDGSIDPSFIVDDDDGGGKLPAESLGFFESLDHHSQDWSSSSEESNDGEEEDNDAGEIIDFNNSINHSNKLARLVGGRKKRSHQDIMVLKKAHFPGAKANRSYVLCLFDREDDWGTGGPGYHLGGTDWQT